MRILIVIYVNGLLTYPKILFINHLFFAMHLKTHHKKTVLNATALKGEIMNVVRPHVKLSVTKKLM